MWKVINIFASAIPMALILIFAGSAQAQTKKLAIHESKLGESRKEPYITYSEFRTATVTGGKQSKGKGRNVPLGKISTIVSLNSLAQYLGRPVEMSKDSPYGASVLAYVNYEGLKLEYVKAPGSDFKLRELKVTSPDWAIVVSGTQLRPGTDTGSLDEPVRRAGHMFIAAPGAGRKAKSHGKLDVMGEDSSIQIDIDEKTQQIREVRFHRML